MRKGFTLLELLVVVSIMGMLGVAATSGYSALQRGMAERGAVAVAATLLRAAQERAHVDRLPTAVFCYNRLVSEPKGDDDNGVVVGMMTAIRRSGRISYVKGSLLFDEFADLDTTYESVESEDEAKKGSGMRLFKFGGGKLNDMRYSIVSERVLRDESAEMVTLFSNLYSPGTGAAGNDGGRFQNGPSSAGGAQLQTNLLSSAFYDLGTSDRAPSSWKVGDGYAFEFAEVQLPSGFVFGQDAIPKNAGQIEVFKTIWFDPDGNSSDTVEIWSTKPNASGMPTPFKRAGTASAKSEEAI